MNSNDNFSILRSIGNVYEEAKESKLSNELFEKLDTDLQILSKEFKLSRIQAFLLANIFALNSSCNEVFISTLTSYFSCNPMKLFEYKNEIESLCTRGILKRLQSTNSFRSSFGKEHFKIHEKVENAIIKDAPIPENLKEEFETVFDVLERLYDIGLQRDEGEISSNELFRQTKSIVESNHKFSFIKKVDQMQLEICNTYLFLYVVCKAVISNQQPDIFKAIEGIFDRLSDRAHHIQNLMTGKNELIKRKLVVIEEANYFNDGELMLSENSQKLLHEEGIKLFSNRKNKPNNVLEPKTIGKKRLFYNNEEQKQLCMINGLLKDSKFIETQKRLQEKKYSKGINVLLYGSPGTGKTESVYQIAKTTNRDIMRVDISQLKSVWFGKSEKIIKGVFIEYKEYAKQCSKVPILLFNEADAIISKRKDIVGSNIAQTENAIQNIILEELENFEGILFATTNMVINLDSAFERRFLFKVEFKNPNISTKEKIWKSKLSNLTKTEYQLLANRFDFSGGQIDNIVRKSEIHEIINGSKTTVNEILSFCNSEQLSITNKVKIGFIKPQ